METNNLWKNVSFSVEGQPLRRQLVPSVHDPANEINVSSPIGAALLSARPGDSVTVRAPCGDVVVQVTTIIP